MVDEPRLDLVVSKQAPEDRQPRGIRRGVSVGSQLVRAEFEDGTASGGWVPALPADREQLVQRAGIPVHHERVPVGAALDRRSLRERISPPIALAGVPEL